MVCMNVLNDLLYLLCEYDFDGVVQVVCGKVLDDLLYLLYEYDVDGLCKCP